MSAAAFCLFVRKTDRQNSEWFHIRVQYYTTRTMLRNAAMPGPLTSSHKCAEVRGCLSVCLSAEDKNNCTVYLF
jgi:hypothetical protein